MMGDFLGSPSGWLTRIEALLEPLDWWADWDEIVMIGVGPLETLCLQGHEDALWPRIEELARSTQVPPSLHLVQY